MQGLFAAAGLTARAALRISKSPAEDLGLLDDTVSEADLLSAMVEHPILVNRPIVCSANGVALCRPSEAVFALLGLPSGTRFTKEDGGEVIAP